MTVSIDRDDGIPDGRHAVRKLHERRPIDVRRVAVKPKQDRLKVGDLRQSGPRVQVLPSRVQQEIFPLGEVEV